MKASRGRLDQLERMLQDEADHLNGDSAAEGIEHFSMEDGVDQQGSDEEPYDTSSAASAWTLDEWDGEEMEAILDRKRRARLELAELGT